MTEIENFYPRPSADLSAPIDDFHFILENNFLDLVKMEWWLIKYEDLFEKTYNFFYNEFRYKRDDGTTVRLPNYNADYFNECKKITDLYSTINEILFLHKKENYFKNELEHYFQISHSKNEARNWVIKNEEIGSKCYLWLSIDDYNNGDELGRIKIIYLNGYDFTINKSELFYTFKFYKLFKHLFYLKRLYPESQTLIRVESKFKNIEKHIADLNPEDETKWGDSDKEWARIIMCTKQQQ